MEEQKLDKGKKIRGDEQTGVLIALDPNSASKPYCFWGCPKVQSKREHTCIHKRLSDPPRRGATNP